MGLCSSTPSPPGVTVDVEPLPRGIPPASTPSSVDTTRLVARVSRVSSSLSSRPDAPERSPSGRVAQASSAGGSRKGYGAFLSHFKMEAALEARWLQTQLEEALGKRCFLDSDDLRDLGELRKHVQDSDVVVLIQSTNVLTRPYCVLELLWAVEANVPIVGINLTNHAFPYDFGTAEAYVGVRGV